jgi:hypothetical protein
MTIDKLPPTPGRLENAGVERRHRTTGGRTIAPKNSRRKEREMQRFKSPDRLRNFSRPTPPSIMSLMSNALVYRDQRTECSAPNDEDMARDRDRSVTSTNSILSSLA